MAALTIRNLPDDLHRALERRASENGRSTEAEIRLIIEHALLKRSDTKGGLGSRLQTIGRDFGGVDLEFDRSKDMAKATDFE